MGPKGTSKDEGKSQIDGWKQLRRVNTPTKKQFKFNVNFGILGAFRTTITSYNQEMNQSEADKGMSKRKRQVKEA